MCRIFLGKMLFVVECFLKEMTLDGWKYESDGRTQCLRTLMERTIDVYERTKSMGFARTSACVQVILLPTPT